MHWLDLVLPSRRKAKNNSKKRPARAFLNVECLEERAVPAGTTFNFEAANPTTYTAVAPPPVGSQAPITAGRVTGAHDLSAANFAGGLSSLAPSQLKLGQIIVFETLISVKAPAPTGGAMQLKEGFNTITTNNSLFGFNGEALFNGEDGYPGTQAPYKIYSAFIDATDSAALNDTNATVASFTTSVVNHEIVGTFNITGLDLNDTVVLEVWMVLDKFDAKPGEIPGGNVQSRLISATTDNGTNNLSTGNQTCPINKVGDFFKNPNSTPDAYSTNEDTLLTVATPGVLVNDTDPGTGDNTTLTVGSVTGTGSTVSTFPAVITTTHGSATINANGSFSYQPALNYNGTDTFTYTAKNSSATSSSTLVTITVNPANDPPVAGNDTFSTNEDTPVATSVLTNDSDVDGDALTITQVNGTTITAGSGSVAVANGTVSLNAAGTQLTFTPSANYNGSASYTYTISDGHGGTATATVNGTVISVNDPPVAVNDSFSTNEDTPVATSVLTNDSDVDGDALTITQVNGSAIVAGGSTVAVTNGTVSLNLAGTQLTFTPGANYNGPASYTYTISDGHGGTATATVNGTVNSVNDPPVAVNDSFTTNEDTAVATTVKTNDSDPDGDALAITQVNGTAIVAGGSAVAVTNGTVSLNAAGTQLTFTPSADYNGPVSYTYTISDGHGGTATATVNGTINSINDPPVAVNDSFSTNEDTAVATSVLTNDSDVDGDTLTITKVNGGSIVAGGSAVSVTNGTVSLNAAGTQLTFTPSANYNGPASYTYTISDGHGGTATATVNGTVISVNDPPVLVQPGDQTIDEGSQVNFSLSATDVDGPSTTYSIVSVNGGAIPAWMSVDSGTGAFTATPPDGPATFTIIVRASDGSLNSDKTFTLNVNNVDPIVDAGNHITLQIGDSFSRPSIDFIDPGADTWTETITYYNKDGTVLDTQTYGPSTSKTFGPITHSYSSTGTYKIVVTVTDDDGGVGTDYFNVNVVGKSKTA